MGLEGARAPFAPPPPSGSAPAYTVGRRSFGPSLLLYGARETIYR